MNDSPLIQRIREEAVVVAEAVPDSTWFLFGSSLGKPNSAADVDLLVLCRCNQDAADIRNLLRPFSLSLPLHLLLMTRDEERELGFITAQGCVQIYP